MWSACASSHACVPLYIRVSVMILPPSPRGTQYRRHQDAWRASASAALLGAAEGHRRKAGPMASRLTAAGGLTTTGPLGKAATAEVSRKKPAPAPPPASGKVGGLLGSLLTEAANSTSHGTALAGLLELEVWKGGVWTGNRTAQNALVRYSFSSPCCPTGPLNFPQAPHPGLRPLQRGHRRAPGAPPEGRLPGPGRGEVGALVCGECAKLGLGMWDPWPASTYTPNPPSSQLALGLPPRSPPPRYDPPVVRIGGDSAPLSTEVKRVWTDSLVRGGV